MKVVEHAPWRLPLMIASSAGVGFACLLLRYVLGKQDMQVERTASKTLTTELTEAQAAVDTLQNEVIDARLHADVQRDAANTLRQDM